MTVEEIQQQCLSFSSHLPFLFGRFVDFFVFLFYFLILSSFTCCMPQVYSTWRHRSINHTQMKQIKLRERERSKEGYQRSCSCHHHQQQQQPPPALSSSTSLIVPLSLSSPCGTQRARHRRQLKTSLNAFNFRCRRKEGKKRRNS